MVKLCCQRELKSKMARYLCRPSSSRKPDYWNTHILLWSRVRNQIDVGARRRAGLQRIRPEASDFSMLGGAYACHNTGTGSLHKHPRGHG